MSIFGFGEIKFGGSDNSGPLNALNDDQFRRTTLRYPLDIGSQDKAHYIVIYIRQQRNTQFGTTTVEDSAFDAAAGAAQMNALSQIQGAISSIQSGKLPTSLGGDLASKFMASLPAGIKDVATSVVGGIGNLFGQTGIQMNGSSAETETVISNSIKKITNNSFIKTTKLTTDAIALYMPDTLNYTYTQNYSDANMGGELGGKIAAAAKSAIDAAGGQPDPAHAISKAIKSAQGSVVEAGKEAIAGAAGSVIGENSAKVLAMAATGRVQNPMLEMIYSAPAFREFSFEFKFYPRDEKEALEVQRIIERLRFHQAPEFFQGQQGFLVPPSEFDIKFYYNGSQNPNIPPMSTAVLTSIQVNYAPEGFSTYEVPGESSAALGRTGMPVAIQIMLNFKETSYLTKQDFKNDRGVSTQANV